MLLFRKKTKNKGLSAETVPAEKQEVKSMKDLYGQAEAAAQDGGKKPAYGQAYKIIIKPLVTEKVSGLGALNKYVFAVAKNANKIEVAKAIEEIYGFKPVGVNVIRMSGKKARYGRISGRRKDWKKAIVTLAPGQTIKIYEGV